MNERMNDSSSSRISGLGKRLGDLGLNLMRPVIGRDIEHLVCLLCAKTFSISRRMRRVNSHICIEKDAQMDLKTCQSVPS